MSLAIDPAIIFDLNGFASTHLVNGVSRVVVVGDKTSGRSEIDGSWVEMFDVDIKKTDLATAPTKRQKMTFDGFSYSVEHVKDDGQIYTVTLSTARVGELETPR